MFYILNTPESRKYLTEIYGENYWEYLTYMYIAVDIYKCIWYYSSISSEPISLNTLKQNIRNKKLGELLNGN